MHGPGLWMYEQREQRVTPVRMIGVNCNLWCPGWDGKDLGGRPEQDPGYTSRPWHQYGGPGSSYHSCPLLWLKIPERIHFKVLSLTYNLQPRQQKFRAMNRAHLASPIRGELGYAHWPQLGSQIH